MTKKLGPEREREREKERESFIQQQLRLGGGLGFVFGMCDDDSSLSPVNMTLNTECFSQHVIAYDK